MEKPSTKELSLAGRFYRMRDDWIRYVITLEKEKGDSDALSHVERLIAVRIAVSINPSGRSWVLSQAFIAKELKCGVRVVKSAVAKLKMLGLIRATKVKLQGHVKMFNAYELVAVEDAIPLAKVHADAPE